MSDYPSRASDHLAIEAAHAVRVRRGQSEPLGDRDPVPGCDCPRCVLLAMHRRGELDGGVVDLLMSDVLPTLAERIPAERFAVARRLKREWATAAMVVLPSEEILVELAARMPGARPAPRPVPRDRDELPLETARRVSVLDICERLGLGVERSGRSWRGDCPFHESESGTSFSVSPEKNVFHCFGCGAAGDGIALVRGVLDVSFPDAVRWIADASAGAAA